MIFSIDLLHACQILCGFADIHKVSPHNKQMTHKKSPFVHSSYKSIRLINGSAFRRSPRAVQSRRRKAQRAGC